MTGIIEWVAESRWVNSKKRAEIFSLTFLLILFFAWFSFLGSAKTTDASDITPEKIVELTNISRQEKGLDGLSPNEKLASAAESKASDMIQKNYFSHTSPNGTTPWHWFEEASYDYNYAGENLAMDFQSAKKMEEAWMASPTHRANILSEKYKEVGVATKEGMLNGHQTILAVVMFGSGDKNEISSASSKKFAPEPEAKKTLERNIPALPKAEARTKTVWSQAPVITSPQSGEYVSGENITIVGRTQPGSEAQILEGENLIGEKIANEEGWFQIEAKNLKAGPHKLAVKNEKSLGEGSIDFFVDRSKPEVGYHLYADKNNSGRLYLKVNASKDNCLVELNGEKRAVTQKEGTVFSVADDKAAAVIRISDQAGNKNFKQIYLGNFYSQKISSNISENILNHIFSPEDFFAAKSGREAMKKNMGLVPHHFLASQLTGRRE
jgi:uncharacterized protein YkwD